MKDLESTNQSPPRLALGDLLWMAGLGAVVFGMVLVLAVAMVPAAEAPAALKPVTVRSSPPVQDPRLLLVIEAGSRLYPDWKEEHRVHIGEPFMLGDTQNEAVVRDLYPDFRTIDGKVLSASDSLKNPAIHVFVRGDSAMADSVYAFLNFPPHFSPKSFFTFQLKEIQGWTGPGVAKPLQAASAKPAPRSTRLAPPATMRPVKHAAPATPVKPAAVDNSTPTRKPE